MIKNPIGFIAEQKFAQLAHQEAFVLALVDVHDPEILTHDEGTGKGVARHGHALRSIKTIASPETMDDQQKQQAKVNKIDSPTLQAITAIVCQALHISRRAERQTYWRWRYCTSQH